MSDRKETFSRRIGADDYEIFRISFDGVRESAGFQRSVRTTRHEYRINGKIVPKNSWLVLKRAAEAA